MRLLEFAATVGIAAAAMSACTSTVTLSTPTSPVAPAAAARTTTPPTTPSQPNLPSATIAAVPSGAQTAVNPAKALPLHRPGSLLASTHVEGGLCLNEQPCHSLFLVDQQGYWAREGTTPNDRSHGTLTPDALDRLHAAVAATRLDKAPKLTGTCPNAFGAPRTRYMWATPGARQVHDVSMCDRIVGADDPLVATLAIVQATAGPGTPGPWPDMTAEIAAATKTLAKSLVGMTERAAVITATTDGVAIRVTDRDGKDSPVTLEYRPDRVNLAVENGRVTDATVG